MALFMVLMLLLIMSMLAAVALRVGALEERMAAATFDRSLAFQAAELALRKGEEAFQSTQATSDGAWANSTEVSPALTVNGIVTKAFYVVSSELKVPLDASAPGGAVAKIVTVRACSAKTKAECDSGSSGERAVVILQSTYSRHPTDPALSKRTNWQENEL